MIRRLFLALATFALLGSPALAQTCSCTKYESAAQFVQFNDVIFKGKAAASKTEYGITTTTFQVIETLKGDGVGKTIAVTHPAPGKSCGGVAFAPGQVMVVVAQGLVEDLGTTGCQIKAYSEAQIRAALK